MGSSTYKPGQQYFVNKNTGAVFQHTAALEGLADLVLMTADEDGELQEQPKRAPQEGTEKLNPTRTPEKAKTAAPAATKTAAPTKPTLTPTDK